MGFTDGSLARDGISRRLTTDAKNDRRRKTIRLAAIDPNKARCPVPDERYDYLCNMWLTGGEYPAFLMVTDIAGLVQASSRAGLGNAFLASNIMATDGIFHVIRAFDDPEVVHVNDEIDGRGGNYRRVVPEGYGDSEARPIADEELAVKKSPTMS